MKVQSCTESIKRKLYPFSVSYVLSNAEVAHLCAVKDLVDCMEEKKHSYLSLFVSC